MLPEVKAIEPALKQVLYHCLEDVQATKAALYLSSSHDLNAKHYEIVTSYQYNSADRKTVGANDDLVDRIVVKRGAFFINGLSADQKFAELLFHQGNDRILVAPLFSRGRLVGFIDMRDKAGRKPFEMKDVEEATKIAEKMLTVLAEHKLFGVAAIQLVEEPTRSQLPGSVRSTVAGVSTSASPAQSRETFSEPAMRAIEAARAFFARRQLAQADEKRAANSSDLEQLNLLLPSILATPGAMLACFSTNAQASVTTAAALGVPDEAVIDMLQQNMRQSARGASHASTVRPALHFLLPFGHQIASIGADSVGTILTTEILPELVDGLFLTVAFGQMSKEDAEQALARFVEQLRPLMSSAITTGATRPDRQLLAERLLEPDFERFPTLVEHSRTVSAIAYRFALFLGLAPAEAETVRLAALVHDVGLRLLDYERLYRRATLTPEEMKGIAEHPAIGAALVEPFLGPEVAHAVLRHHERVDGRGYPSRISGQQIPLASRIIQIVDAWVAMTAGQSYQSPISADEASTRLRDAAGTQFDDALVERFLNERDSLL